MGVTKADIVAKAKLCVDETLTSTTFNSNYLPIEKFVDEAVRWVIDSVPIKALGAGSQSSSSTITDGVATFDNVGGRFLWAKGGGWDRVVSSFIYDDNPRCAQLNDSIFGASTTRPVVVINKGGKTIELHKVSGASTVGIMPYAASSNEWGSLPAEFLDIIAWRTAELTLSAISDVNGAAVCANKVVEHLESFQR